MCGASVSNKIDTARLSGWHGESTRLPIETQPTPNPFPTMRTNRIAQHTGMLPITRRPA